MKLWLALGGATGIGILVACSGSSRATPDVADASPTQDATDVAADATNDASHDAPCGPAPWVTLGLVVASAAQPDAGVEGATLTSSVCPGVSQTSGADGTIVAAVSKGKPFVPRFVAPAYVDTLVTEMKFDADRQGLSVLLPPRLFTALIPGWTADSAALIVGLAKDGGGGACATLDGVSISVVGHPEATVTYLSAGSIPTPTNDTATTSSGRALVTGIAPGQVVQLSATKPGCTVDFVKYPYTGNVPTEAGALTLVPGYVR